MSSRRAGRIAAGAAAIALTATIAAPAYAGGDDAGGEGRDFYIDYGWDGRTDAEPQFGTSDDSVYSGDWDGDGDDTLLIRRGRTIHMANLLRVPRADHTFQYGRSSDELYVGDWDGDGVDTVALRRGRTFYFANNAHGRTGLVSQFGRSGDEVLVGDWDGDGHDTLAVRRGATYYFTNSNRHPTVDRVISFGRADDLAHSGDWNGNGRDTLAVQRGRTFYLTNSLSSGSDRVTSYGRSDDVALIGDWTGNGRDSVGVRRAPEGPQVPDGVTGNRAIGYTMMVEYGYSSSQWSCLDNLWRRESGWNHLAANPYSSAYGIPQSLPGSKMASHGSDWRTNPRTQIAWGLDYINGRYGSPCGAWNAFLSKGWYADPPAELADELAKEPSVLEHADPATEESAAESSTSEATTAPAPESSPSQDETPSAEPTAESTTAPTDQPTNEPTSESTQSED